MGGISRFIFGTGIVFFLAACSGQPATTALLETRPLQANKSSDTNMTEVRKTLSSDVLSAIAIERVIGQQQSRLSLATNRGSNLN